MSSLVLISTFVSMPIGLAIPLIILGLAGGIVGGFFVGRTYYLKTHEKRVGDAKESASKILSDAKENAGKILDDAKTSSGKMLEDAKSRSSKTIEEANELAKTAKREAVLEAKEEVHKLRFELDRESKERRQEITRVEQRLIQKEEMLDKRTESVEQLKIQVSNKEAEIAKVGQATQEKYAQADKKLQEIAKLTREEAKKEVIAQIETEAKKDAAILVKSIEDKAKDEADKKAREVITLAVQRCAVDHSSDATTSVVVLPSEDMKGRIIGREGRNIRALENATGIDFIVDDTPEVVILSGFDPIRREIAKTTLEKLILDGRIHPARIEEMVERVTRDLEHQIKEAGEAAMYEAGVFGLHPEIINTLGRLKYRTSYGQNVLKHSIEVAHLAGLMASELGLDVALAKRGGLLHDLGKAVDFEIEGTHVQIGADIAKKHKESKEVINCILAHHGDVEPSCMEAVLVAASDAISGSRTGARRESLENYIKRLQKLEEISNSFAGVEKSFAIQAGREIRIIVNPADIDDAQTLFLSKEIAKKIENELEYPGQIKVNVIRELRKVEYAK